MNTDGMMQSHAKPAVIGLVMLLAGLLIGMAIQKHLVQGPVLLAEGQTAAPAARAGSTGQIPVPDKLFPDANDAWDPFREMRDLQAEMDQMFQRSVSQFQSSPMMSPFKNDTGYSLSLDVRELKDRYEVRAYLPDAQATDANVKLEGNQLEVAVTNRPAAGQQNTNSIVQTDEWGSYTQVVELAGKLKSDQMKVEHKSHELLITIPKAGG